MVDEAMLRDAAASSRCVVGEFLGTVGWR